MTNGEKYKTAEERSMAFRKFCASKICKWEGKEANCIFSDKIHDVCTHKCEFAWLDLEYKEDLKPCPFCGSENVSVYKSNVVDVWHVTCNRCGCKIDSYMNREIAISSWNSRV